MVTETWRRQIVSGSSLERRAAVEHCKSEGPVGWELLADLARDESLDLPVRVAATVGLTPPVPADGSTTSRRSCSRRTIRCCASARW